MTPLDPFARRIIVIFITMITLYVKKSDLCRIITPLEIEFFLIIRVKVFITIQFYNNVIFIALTDSNRNNNSFSNKLNDQSIQKYLVPGENIFFRFILNIH